MDNERFSGKETTDLQSNPPILNVTVEPDVTETPIVEAHVDDKPVKENPTTMAALKQRVREEIAMATLLELRAYNSNTVQVLIDALPLEERAKNPNFLQEEFPALKKERETVLTSAARAEVHQEITVILETITSKEDMQRMGTASGPFNDSAVRERFYAKGVRDEAVISRFILEVVSPAIAKKKRELGIKPLF